MIESMTTSPKDPFAGKIQRSLIALACALAVSGCQSKLTGNLGNFVFAYDADDDIVDFNKAIAVGAKLKLEVSKSGGAGAVDLTSATTDDAEVLEVSSFEGNEIFLEATGEGLARIEVEGEWRGDSYPDSVDMRARIPEVTRLGHTCTNDDDAYYLVSQRIYIPFELELEDGQPTIGYGYYPFDFSPASALSLEEVEGAGAFMHLDADDSPGAVTIESELDDTSLSLELTTIDDADDVEVVLGDTLQEIDVGDTLAVYVLPTIGGIRVCQAESSIEVASATPAICNVDATNQAGEQREYGWIEVEGLSEGTCQIEVTYTERDQNDAVPDTFTAEVDIAP